MFRRILSLATFVACVTVSLWAAERATVALVDGSRQSGLVAFHGTGNRNIIDNFFNLAQPGGPDKTIPLDQVAIIDFVGGDPAVAEFQQLPGDRAHLLVLRGGGMQRGHLVNLINGDAVQWENESGQGQQFAIHDVARIFLNAQASRQLYPQLAASAAASAPPSNGSPNEEAVAAGAVRVSANQPWVAANLGVRKGQRIRFESTGQVHFSPSGDSVAGPDGNPSVQVSNLPVRGMAIGGLIGRVGNGAPFPIGSNREPITMPDTGQLMLGVNDTEMSDNSGFFAVTTSRSR